MLSHYEILESIGEGGMGTVFRARDTRLNRTVAIKSLRGASPDRKARFLQEAQSASALNHPNIVTVHDLLTEAGEDFIVMEYIPGQTLDRVIPKNGLRLDEVLRLAIPVAAALTAAHEAGIVHRDVKPSNIIVRDDGTVKVLDFGLAKLTEAALADADEATRTMRAETEEGAILGTVSYMSPEQAEGRKVDARSDIFSFGAVLYEMVTGHRAFTGSSKLSTLSAILKEDPKPLSGLGLDMPRELDRIIARCLRKDIDRRYQLMKEVRNALQELKEDSESGRLTAVLPQQRSKPNWTPYLAVAAVVVAAAGFALWRASQKPAAAPEFTLRQITQDAALTITPALSPDGKMLAYASTRAGDGGLDIWLQPIAESAQPVRLTRDPADDRSPEFSPDGGQIVFASHREGGGVYVVPTFGGEERLLLRGNFFNPGFSPDGRLIAASRDSFAVRTFVVPVNGGEPRQIVPDFYMAAFMAWSPDGRKILVNGNRQQGFSKADWWLVDLAGGKPQALNLPATIPRNVMGVPPFVSSWQGDFLYFATRNLHRIRIDVAAGKLVGAPERLTHGSGSEGGPAAVPFPSPSGWRIAFSSFQAGESRLTALNLDANAGKVTSGAETLFADGAHRIAPSLSADGKLLAYVRRTPDGFSIRVLDRATGGERTVIQQRGELRGRISPDGSTIAYNLTAQEEKETDIFLVSSKGGASRKACGNCGLFYAWSPDGKRLIYRAGSPMRFHTFDLGSGQSTEILSHPRYHVHGATYSPDQRWLAFHLGPGDGPSHIFVTPVRDGRGGPENEWIPIFTQPGYNSRPWWSPDGKLLYLSSDAAGPRSIWAQRLDLTTRKPIGQPWIVYTPKDSDEIILNGHQVGVGLGPNQLILGTNRSRANIWLAE